MINYSIIIPHKNIPELLRRCLDSIPRRDDVQIIVVDDNSDPEIVKFDCFPGLGEPCVEVYFTKEGKGAGYARNVGLEHVVGKWILFADADDLFCPNMLEKLDRYKDSDAQVIVFRHKTVMSDTLEPSSKREFSSPEIFEAAMRGEISPPMYLSIVHTVWAKMVSHHFLASHNISFEEVYCANDLFYCKMLAVYAERIILTKECIYILTDRPVSLSKDLNSLAFRIRYDVAARTNNWLRSIGKPEYEQSFVHLARWAYSKSYEEYVRLFFLAVRDGMLSAGKAYRMVKMGRLKRFQYPRLYALYLLLGGRALRDILRKVTHKVGGRRVFSPLKMEIHLTEHCNLNCIRCSHYSPLASPTFCNMEQLDSQMGKLSTVQTMFSKIMLLGGEPLLHPNIVEAFRIVRKYCKDPQILLVTNGILLSKMSDAFWDACVRYDITVALTAYPIDVNYEALKDLCMSHGVRVRTYGNRKDSGFNRDLLDESGKGSKYNYYLCGTKSEYLQLVGSRIYPCSQCAYVKYLNHAFGCNFRHSKGDYLELDKLSRMKLRWFAMRPKPFCRYCDFKERQRIEWSLSKREKSEWIIER